MQSPSMAVVTALILGCLSVVIAYEGPRFDCYPDHVKPVTEQQCLSRGCLFTETTHADPPGTPTCYFDAYKMGYTAKAAGEGQWHFTKNKGPKNPWGLDSQDLVLTQKDLGNGVLNIRLEPNNTKRYEPPLDLPRQTVPSDEKLMFFVTEDNMPQSDPTAFSVVRADGSWLFDTAYGALIFSDKFIQVSIDLPTENMYGWGENIHQNIKHDFSRYNTWGMLARDEAPNSKGLDTKNLYGVHPFYMVVEDDGRAHGVFFLNSNAQEVTTFPAPGLLYRTIGGILDMYVFPGPSPADVTRQYLAFVGRPFLPPYWALGYQLCRYGYKDLEDMKTRIAAVRAAGIPLDVAYADIDYMDRYKIFTVGEEKWPNFGDYIKQLHDWGMKSILIWDPAIEVDYDAFERAIAKNVSFIEWERNDQVPQSIQQQYPLVNNTKLMLAVVWPDKHVAFPDFLDPQTTTSDWWTDEFKRFHEKVPFDGAWIDMNEPSAFGTNEDHPWYFNNPDHPKIAPLRCPMNATDKDSEWDAPPFQTHAAYFFNGYLSSKTLCMLALTRRGTERFYNTKNLYGWSEQRATQAAIHASTGKRAVVIGRSTFPSAGRFGGHWLGDNTARWEDLRTSVIGAQEFNIFGIPYVGSDVCGLGGKSNEQLCLRWQQMGSFHSFFRNHNDKGQPPQDPAVWPTVAAATRKANLFRYAHLPYLYSLHYRSSLVGDTVIRPVFFEFPQDQETLNLSEQFFWGGRILVAPVLYENHTEVKAYIPSENVFFSIYDYNYGQNTPFGFSNFSAPTTFNVPAFVRASSIIPRQAPEVTTTATRANPFNLLIVPDSAGTAAGELFWDDGDSIIKEPLAVEDYHYAVFSYKYVANTSTLSITNAPPSYNLELPKLAYLEVFDYPTMPNFDSFILGNQAIEIDATNSSYDATAKILLVTFKNTIDFSSANGTLISWNHNPKEDVHSTSTQSYSTSTNPSSETVTTTSPAIFPSTTGLGSSSTTSHHESSLSSTDIQSSTSIPSIPSTSSNIDTTVTATSTVSTATSPSSQSTTEGNIEQSTTSDAHSHMAMMTLLLTPLMLLLNFK